MKIRLNIENKNSATTTGMTVFFRNSQGVVGGGLCEGGIVEGKHAWIGEYAELLRRKGISGYPGDVGTV